MMNDMDALEFVKDYLKSHGLKSTLECFEKEENYKIMDKKGKVIYNYIGYKYGTIETSETYQRE
jgi:hypothetical protein